MRQVAVMDVMHARALQPVFEPTRVSERDVIVAKVTIDREQEDEYPEVHHGDLGNRPANDVGKCSATKTQACGSARAVQDALNEVLTVARERGKHRRRMMY